MAVENATYIGDLNPAYPAGGEPIAQGDDHLRLIKQVLKNTFPNLGTVFNSAYIITTLGYTPVNKAGDTMTGALTATGLAAQAAGEGGELQLKETASGKTCALDMIAADNTMRIWFDAAMGANTFTFKGNGDFAASNEVYGKLFLAATGQAGYVFSSDGDTGMYNPSDGLLRLRVNNVDKIFIGGGTGKMEIDNRVKVYGGATNDSNAWNYKPLVIEETHGSNPGIGFHAPANSSAGIFKYYGGSGQFECRNYSDTGFLDFQAAKITANNGLDVTGAIMRQYAGLESWNNIYMKADGNNSRRVYLEHSLTTETNLSAYHRPGMDYGARFITGAGGSEFLFTNGGYMKSSAGQAPSSDSRLKSSQKVIEGALAKLKQLSGKTYVRQDVHNMDGSHPTMAGVIAQDVRAVLPEAVIESPPMNDWQREEAEKLAIEGFLSVDYNGVIALLVEAVKELSAEVAALKAAK